MIPQGFTNHMEFHDWKLTTRSARACSSNAAFDTGAVEHPAATIHKASITLTQNIP